MGTAKKKETMAGVRKRKRRNSQVDLRSPPPRCRRVHHAELHGYNDSSDHDISILYATETGTAQEVADRIARECPRGYFEYRVCDIGLSPPVRRVDLGTSCHIRGAATTGSGVEPRAMMPLWNSLLRSDLPDDLFIRTHALCPKKLACRLTNLGGRELCAIGERDDQHLQGIEGALDTWIEQLIVKLLELYPCGDSLYFLCKRRLITAEDWFQDVRHFEFLSERDMDYLPGDVAIIHPVALASEVDSLLTHRILFAHRDTDQPLPECTPQVTTLPTLFTRYLDFNAVPCRSFLELLRYFANDDELYCRRVKRTIREVLADFRSIRMPRDYVFDLVPPLRQALPKYKHPREIHLCVTIVQYRAKLRVPRKGVCTSLLAALQPGDKLRLTIQKGLVSFPNDLRTPVICVGPGTGIAPMRAVIEDRVIAGSEDGPEGLKRVYVQDLLRMDKESVWELLGVRQGTLIISGSSNKMPTAVREVVKEAVAEFWDMSARDAASYLPREGRIIEGCWS
ncbi:hypothetical protein V8E55_010773 [Tylopilus felleus]